jgi:hypothetical protein
VSIVGTPPQEVVSTTPIRKTPGAVAWRFACAVIGATPAWIQISFSAKKNLHAIGWFV